MNGPDEAIRLDKWLWHARFAKTRKAASDLIARRRIRLNNELVGKNHRAVRIGDVLTLTLARTVLVLEVRATAKKRGATNEARAVPTYKEMVVASKAADIVYSSLFTGVHGSYLKGSIANAGMDPDNLPEGDKSHIDFSSSDIEAKAWKDIWGAGQGVGTIDEILPAYELVLRMEKEYRQTLARLKAY